MNYVRRLKLLQESLKNERCDALLIEDKINLYYLTGCDLSAGKLLITQDPESAFLIVDQRYFELCKKQCPFKVLPAEEMSFSRRLNETFQFIQTLGFESDKMTYKGYQQLAESFMTSSDKKLVPLDNPLKLIRTIKDADEITMLKQAAELGSRGFDFLCSQLKEGISEIQLARDLEIFWKKNGSKGVAFDPIIAFGPNSSMPHYRAGERTLQQGDIVLFDIGVNDQFYHSDMTRTFFFGEPDPLLLQIHSIVREAQEKAISYCKQGVKLGDLDRVAREHIFSHGFGEYFTHSLGHGVGLEIHEYPLIRQQEPAGEQELTSGMVITIEPGIYIPNLGGVRIEDTLLISESGIENLTNRPKEPFL